MPRIQSKVTVNNFVGGLVTDFHELNTPANVTVSEDNCDLDRKGSRKRRLGIDFEPGYELSTDSWTLADLDSFYLGNQVWESVNNDGNQNFLVVQVGSKLYYYDMTKDPVSSGLLPFTTDLTGHKAYSAVTNARIASSGVSIASGKGVIFISGEILIPFYVTYDADTNTITETEIDIKIRDLKLASGATDYEAIPTTMDYKLNYDYFNQGWYYNKILDVDHNKYSSVLELYYVREALSPNAGYRHYPPLSKSWWAGKVHALHDSVPDSFETFAPLVYDSIYTGNFLAPLGHYIVDPFNVDRSGVSGIAGFEIEQSPDRPSCVAFYAGKVFYGWKNQIFFSQTLLEDFSVSGKCYQQADPTAEYINDLVATDGGVIPLQYSGEIIAMVPFENSLIVFCTNGVWAISGGSVGQGFSADGFSIYKITSVGAISPRSVISIDGTPCWWSKIGIYLLNSSPGKQGFSVDNICKDKVQLFYDAIPGTSKLTATGAYDRLRKIIVWIYNGSTDAIDGNVYFCNKVLNFDTILGAFFPYTISDLTELTPRVADVFALLDVSTSTETVDVTDAAGNTVTDSLGAAVTVNETVLGNFDNQSSIGVKFLTFSKEITGG